MRNVEFIVNDNLIDSIIGMHIHRSMDEIAGSYAFELDDFYASEIKLDDPVQIRLNGKQIISGYIDMVQSVYNKTSQSLIVKGMDKPGDLLTCPHESSQREFKKQTIESIIKILCQPFGITVTVKPSASIVQTVRTETYMASMSVPISILISELCRDYGVQALSMGDGKLTITGAGVATSKDTLEYGKNIIYAEAMHSNENRYKNYYVRGIGIGTNNKSTADYIEPEGTSTDSVVKRYRPYVSFFENIADKSKCQKRAKYEMQIRAGLSRYPTYYVPTWDQSDGSIWDINTLITPNDPKQGFEKQMIINTIDYYLNDDMEEGTVNPYAKLKLVYPETYKESGSIKGIYDA